jgi:two-component system chemotaxis sensor kinase CheA
MNKSALIESLMSTFVEEVGDHVRSFNHDLLALESGQGDPASLLQSLFRTAHNLKEASRAVDVDLVEKACHGLEDILARARDGERPLDADAFAILFATADAIEDAGTRLKEKQSLASSPLAALISRLSASPRGVGTTPVAAPPPSARVSPAPVSAPVSDPAPVPAPPAVPAPAAPMPERREGDTLRVSANKLDTVLARSGELLLAVRQTERRRDEWATLEEAALGLASDFRRLQTLVSPGGARRRGPPSSRSRRHRQVEGRPRACRGRGRDGRSRAGADGGGTGLRRAQLADGPVRRSR